MIKKSNMYTHTLPVVLFFGLFLLPDAYAAPVSSDIPNYANGVKEVNKQLFTGKDALKINEQDMAVMNKAGADLALQMPHPGLKVGTKAPDFSLKDPSGKTIKLSDQLKNGPVILVFYRGAWCPYCNLQMKQLRDIQPQISKYKASLIAITPQTPDKSLEQFKQDGFPFPVLSDLDYKIIKSYNLLWEVSPELDAAYKHAFGLDVSNYNGNGRRGLPVPGTFVIDKKGIVRATFADTDYQKRMEPADILAALERLR